jgi:hypothetical protein
MIKNNKVEEIKQELNLDLDLGLALAEAEGNLNHLARESNSCRLARFDHSRHDYP